MLYFFLSLWTLVESKVTSLTEDQRIPVELFFLNVCLGFEVSAEWNEAIFQYKKIPKKLQKDLMLTSEEMFLCGVEFCRLFHERFSHKLEFIVNLLDSMQMKPENHAAEWSIWKEVVKNADTTQLTLSPFNWELELP